MPINQTIADLLPPILLRGLKDLKARFVPPALLFKAGQYTIEHRDSASDREVITQIFYRKDYDLSRLRRFDEIMSFYANATRPIIIDAGANIGASTVWFRINFPSAEIVAIEPHPGNFSLLRRNIERIGANAVIGAIASVPGRLQVFDPGEGEWGFRTGISEQGSAETVRAYTLEELVPAGSAPFILKVDIEGAEADLFSRHSELLADFPVVIVELHDWMLPRSGSSRSFLSWHTSLDRDFVYIGEYVFSLSNTILPTLI